MSQSDFKSFPSVQHLDKLEMRITQKIHGSNAQIRIDSNGDTELIIKAGSRNRWLTLDDDNYGFFKFVHDHFVDFTKLGEGTHYGEWAGPGINSGEGLTEKTLFLFSHPDRYRDIQLPPRVTFVPELYVGPFDLMAIESVMSDLKRLGSRAVSGFKNPEGIVIEVAGKRYKKVFTPEESKWCGVKKVNPKRALGEFEDFSHLLQPVRLEKLISKDERLIKEYPNSLPEIAKEYVADLVKEQQICGDEDEIKRVRKACSREVFWFIRSKIDEMVKDFNASGIDRLFEDGY